MHARVNTILGTPAQIESAGKTAEERVIPAAQAIHGYAGMFALVDRASGKTMAITLWESEEALRASEEAATGIRSEGSGGGQVILSVERFEVVHHEIV